MNLRDGPDEQENAKNPTKVGAIEVNTLGLG